MPSPPLPSSDAAPAAPLLQRYGNYLLIRKLTEGGMAEIFLAKHLGAEGFERDLVIKRLLPQLSDVQEFVRMFLDEARLAARLSHPNIVQISDLGQAEGRYFIAMEYLAGEDFSSTLRTVAQRGRYTPLPVVAQVLSAAARGLHHAHEMQDENGAPLGIVHRDISPSNLHLTYQGQVKVLDFGIAWAQTRLTKTQAGVVKGKYSYMAPEQARGEQVDRRADVYSLGVSLYEALTHIRPLVREHDLAMLNAVLAGEYAPPRKHRPDLPEALEAITLKAMSLKPEDRYPTASAFADALDAVLPSVGGPVDLGAFLKESFGEARVIERTRIPSLATLTGASEAGQATLLTGFESSTELPTVAGRKTPALRSGTSERTEAAPAPTPVTVPARKPWLWPLVGAVVGLLVLGAGALLLRPGDDARAPVTSDPAVAAPAVPAPPAGEADAAGEAAAEAVDPVMKDGATPAEAAAAEAPGEAAGAAEVAPSTPTPVAAATARKTSTPVNRPTVKETLTVADIEQVVARGQSRYFSCFETHKAELPTDAGELTLRITIPGTGRATAAVDGQLEGSGVARCIAGVVHRLRFPAHRDRPLQVGFPISWRVER